MWFEKLTGFREESPEQVRANLLLHGSVITSKANGRRMDCGRLEIPPLAGLRQRVQALPREKGKLRLREVIDDVQDLHRDPDNAGSLFQVASQFNLLEMAHPGVTPEQGLSGYEHDRTQGPACAIACGAGTIYRNYFIEVGGRRGQTAEQQIDCLADLGQALGNSSGRLWAMRNGYALPTAEGLAQVSGQIEAMGETERDSLRGRLRIGVQWDTQVTLNGCTHRVNQAYASALPVAYTDVHPDRWAPFARLVLEAAYEATLCAAALNAAGGGSRRVFLTLLGGGAFGNPQVWILSALERALDIFRDWPLEIFVVSYQASIPGVSRLAASRK